MIINTFPGQHGLTSLDAHDVGICRTTTATPGSAAAQQPALAGLLHNLEAGLQSLQENFTHQQPEVTAAVFQCLEACHNLRNDVAPGQHQLQSLHGGLQTLIDSITSQVQSTTPANTSRLLSSAVNCASLAVAAMAVIAVPHLGVPLMTKEAGSTLLLGGGEAAKALRSTLGRDAVKTDFAKEWAQFDMLLNQITSTAQQFMPASRPSTLMSFA